MRKSYWLWKHLGMQERNMKLLIYPSSIWHESCSQMWQHYVTDLCPSEQPQTQWHTRQHKAQPKPRIVYNGDNNYCTHIAGPRDFYIIIRINEAGICQNIWITLWTIQNIMLTKSYGRKAYLQMRWVKTYRRFFI